MTELVYNLVEFCRVTQLDEELVVELIEHGILDHPGTRRERWQFSSEEVDRCLRAERMRRDLELNFHGVALALELLERNRRMRQRINYLEKLMERLQD